MVQIPLIFLSNINNSLFPLTKYSREAQVETSLVTRIFAMGCCYRFVCFKLVLALTLYKMFKICLFHVKQRFPLSSTGELQGKSPCSSKIGRPQGVCHSPSSTGVLGMDLDMDIDLDMY